MFENMEYIYEVYQAGSFSQAAKKLYISQPSLSASVKRIEERAGYPIFDRSTKPVGLTDFGRKYVDAMMQIRSIEENFEKYAADYGELKTGELKVGGTNLVASMVMPKYIRRFTSEYPNVEVDLTEGISSDLESLLSDGKLDMVIDYTVPVGENFDSAKIEDEYLILTVPRSFAVNGGLEKYRLDIESIKDGSFPEGKVPAVPLEKFAEVPFVLLKKKNDTHKRAVSMCQAVGFVPRSVFVSPQQTTAYHVCASGMGAAFVSSILLREIQESPNLLYYRLDFETAHRELSLLWKKERYITRAMQEFKRIVTER